jgi:rhodanese-related sulfurtransferase
MMIKRIYLKLFVIAVLASLVAFTVFSGCKPESSEELEISPSETAEEETAEKAEVEQDIEDEPDEEEASQDATQEEEEAFQDTAQEEEAQQPQIMDISPAEVFQIMENDEDYLIVDIRTQEEYDSGHLEGALLLPVQELEDRLDELPMDKPIIVYCRSGNRSRTAANILIDNGFTMVYDMGGISSWTEEGYPIVVEE